MKNLAETAPKLGIRALKQITAAIHGLSVFQQSARDLSEAYEDSSINRRYKGLQLNVNLALTKVSFSSARCRLKGAAFDAAVAKLLTDALMDTEKRRATIANGAIAQTLLPFNNESNPKPVD